MLRRTKTQLKPSSPTADARASMATETEGRYILTIPCEELRDDGAGGIVEAPDLLKKVESLRERLSRLLQGKATIHPIAAYLGRYEFEVSADSIQGDLLAGRNIRDLIVLPLEHALKIIDDNARCVTPKTAAELGLSAEILRVEDTLSSIRSLGVTAAIRSSDNDDSSKLPSAERDALSAIAREPRARQRIHGIVTGVCLEPDGVRIEVNRGVRPAIPGMTLEVAIPFLQRSKQVSGFLVYVGDRAVLEGYEFLDGPEEESFRF